MKKSILLFGILALISFISAPAQADVDKGTQPMSAYRAKNGNWYLGVNSRLFPASEKVATQLGEWGYSGIDAVNCKAARYYTMNLDNEFFGEGPKRLYQIQMVYDLSKCTPIKLPKYTGHD